MSVLTWWILEGLTPTRRCFISFTFSYVWCFDVVSHKRFVSSDFLSLVLTSLVWKIQVQTRVRDVVCYKRNLLRDTVLKVNSSFIPFHLWCEPSPGQCLMVSYTWWVRTPSWFFIPFLYFNEYSSMKYL